MAVRRGARSAGGARWAHTRFGPGSDSGAEGQQTGEARQGAMRIFLDGVRHRPLHSGDAPERAAGTPAARSGDPSGCNGVGGNAAIRRTWEALSPERPLVPRESGRSLPQTALRITHSSGTSERFAGEDELQCARANIVIPQVMGVTRTDAPAGTGRYDRHRTAPAAALTPRPPLPRSGRGGEFERASTRIEVRPRGNPHPARSSPPRSPASGPQTARGGVLSFVARPCIRTPSEGLRSARRQADKPSTLLISAGLDCVPAFATFPVP
jgi:hypothetical protein